MRNGEEREPDPHKVFVGKLIHQLILRGWRPPKTMPPEGTLRLLDTMERLHPLQTLNLTETETELLELLAAGHTYGSAADKRGTSIESVKQGVKLARGKLGANNSTHAVAIAIRKGVI